MSCFVELEGKSVAKLGMDGTLLLGPDPKHPIISGDFFRDFSQALNVVCYMQRNTSFFSSRAG